MSDTTHFVGDDCDPPHKTDLQTALDRWDDPTDPPHPEDMSDDVDLFVEAARLVANSPTYKWCEVHHSGVNWRTGADIMQGVERCDAHRLLTMPGQEATVAACDVIAAALTPGDTDE